MPSSNTYLGIDIGGTGVKGAPVHIKKGELKADRFRLDTPQPATPKAVAKTVQAVAEQFGWTGPIGLTVPARVRRGTVETAANIDPKWIGTKAAKLFQKATGCSCTVLNDADAAGLAEMAVGAARGKRDGKGVVLVLTVGTGIGSALFLDGHLVPNTELGHLWLAPEIGCIAEHYASNRVRTTNDMPWAMWAARLQVVLEHAEFVFSPDRIVIGGGVSRPDRWAEFGPLLKTQAKLVPAALQNNAGIVGAAIAAAQAREA